MSEQSVNKLSHAKFSIKWSNVTNSELILNFNPVITQYKLTGTYCLLHWQAKPKYYRRWGIYYSEDDYYYSFDWNELNVNEKILCRALQIDESKFKTVPTAVILLHATLNKTDKGITLNAI